MAQKIEVTKIDAARRQLETAIKLYFIDADPVSIHTLTAAAYNILRDVTKQKGADPMLIKGQMLELVKPEFQRMIRDKANEAENFFKHADRDHEARLDFNPDLTDLHLIDACAQYHKLTGEEPPLFVAYRIWFLVHRPDCFLLPDELKSVFKANAASIVEMGRTEFFTNMLPVIKNMGASRKFETSSYRP